MNKRLTDRRHRMVTDSIVKQKVFGLDGLRVYAIVMIVACHTGALAITAGGVGNKIFFSLSGFLAYFSIRSVNSFNGILRFYAKRFIRIVPAFWAITLIAWKMFPGTFSLTDLSSNSSLLLNLLFIKNRGHLWFLQHLVLMYLLAPMFWYIHKGIVVIFTRLRFSENTARYASAFVFILLAIIEKECLTTNILCLSGEGSHSQFQVWMFMFGFATAIIGDKCIGFKVLSNHPKVLKYGKAFSSLYALAFIILFTVSVIPTIHEGGILLLFSNDYLRTICSCILYYLFLLFGETMATKILDCKFMLQLSKLSFGIYLWHYYVISMFQTESTLYNFIFVFFISVCLALFTYNVVEKSIVKLVSKHHVVS